MHRIIQELIPKSVINADRNLCPITAMENLVRFFFCVISGKEDLFLPLASGSYFPYFTRISLTSTIASSRTVEIIPMEEKSKLGMHLAG